MCCFRGGECGEELRKIVTVEIHTLKFPLPFVFIPWKATGKNVSRPVSSTYGKYAMNSLLLATLV